MILLRMALFNLLKHRRRTLLIVVAVLLSVLVMEVVAGMLHGIRDNFFRNLTQEGGHVQISAPGRRSSLNPFTLDHRIEDYRAVVAALQALPGAAEEVLHFGALVQHGERTLTLAGLGVRSDSQFFTAVREGMVSGTFPPASGTVVLSAAVAELLLIDQAAAAGGSADLLIVVEDSSGSPFYLQYPVGGIFRTAAADFDEQTFFITHTDAQELVYLPDQTIEIRVRLPDPQNAEPFAAAARAALPHLEVRTFRDIHAGVIAMLEMMDFFIVFMNLLVVTVAASVITNAILMNVFERIREFGTLRAIGLKRRGVVRIILTEGLVQGVAGAVLGLATGIPIVLYFSVNGLDWGGITEAFGMGTSAFTFAYSVGNSALNAFGGVLIALAGSLYAALVGARLSIMEALRYD